MASPTETPVTEGPLRNRIIGTELLDPNSITLNPANWRLHPQPQQDAVEGVLEEVGWVQGVILNQRTGNLLDGHLRVKLARKHDEKEIPVQIVDLSPEEENLILAVLDPLAGMAGANEEKLQALLDGVDTDNSEVLALLETVARSHDIKIKSMGGKKGTDDDLTDRGEELQKKWQTASGQLWQLGDHRLICGDSLDPAVVERLMQGQICHLFSTDPPYLVEYDGDNRPRGKGKDWSNTYKEPIGDDEAKAAFLMGIFEVWQPYLVDKAAWFVWHADQTATLFETCLKEHGLLVHQRLIWAKPIQVGGRVDYEYRHEPCFYGWMKGNRPYKRAEWFSNNASSVWEVDYEGKKRSVGKDHPTQKPIELFARPMRNHTKPGQICAEPFSGSGSQIVAGEQERRVVYACDQEPVFVAVAIERWHQMTGQQPELLEG